jgi:hypothetical protein
MNSKSLAQQVGLVALYLVLGAANGLVWARLSNLPELPNWHLEMVNGTAPAPNQYRPLTPWIAEGLLRLFPHAHVQVVYLVLRAATTGLVLLLFDRYLRVWFRPAAAAAGALCLGAVLPFTYLYVVQESDPINLLVFVLSFWALARGRDLWLIPLILVGTLNRESTAMIPAVYFLARTGQRPPAEVAWRTAAIAAAWAVVYGLLLRIYGPRAYYCDPVMLGENFKSWLPSVSVLLLFGPMWILAILGAPRGPLMLRRALWLFPIYLILHYIVARVEEVRLFLPLAPVIIPLSWWALFPEAVATEPVEGSR